LLHTARFEAAIEALKVPRINKFMAALRNASLPMWLAVAPSSVMRGEDESLTDA
jgi:hypothetical protein